MFFASVGEWKYDIVQLYSNIYKKANLRIDSWNMMNYF